MNTNCKDSFAFTHLFKFLLVTVFLTVTISPLFAQGNLLIYPKRVVFEGRNKIEKLVLSNVGKDTAVYNISFLEYKMKTNGELKIISEPEEGQYFASPNVRFYPRKVTLAPNESQTVKVQLRNSQKLKEGEYRSHLYFRAGLNNSALGEKEQSKDSTVTVSLKPVFGLSIACIVRKGISTTSISISNIKLIQPKEDYYALKFLLNRSGNMSVYGDFTVHYITAEGTKYEVAKMKGVGVYTPGTLRDIKIRLYRPKNVVFNGGYFKVAFTKNESKKILTEANLKL
ncbi:MAG: molecular chaperone [Flavobacteriaceae bacterium]|nr:MAG: molecular chaperone [Flavobacteriaceae bacterium]